MGRLILNDLAHAIIEFQYDVAVQVVEEEDGFVLATYSAR